MVVGIRPIKAVLGLDLICVFETEEKIRSMNPDKGLLKQLGTATCHCEHVFTVTGTQFPGKAEE